MSVGSIHSFVAVGLLGVFSALRSRWYVSSSPVFPALFVRSYFAMGSRASRRCRAERVPAHTAPNALRLDRLGPRTESRMRPVPACAGELRDGSGIGRRLVGVEHLGLLPRLQSSQRLRTDSDGPRVRRNGNPDQRTNPQVEEHDRERAGRFPRSRGWNGAGSTALFEHVAWGEAPGSGYPDTAGTVPRVICRNVRATHRIRLRG